MINLPHTSDASREVGAETVRANNPLGRVDRTDKAADRPSEQAQDEAQRDDDEPHDTCRAGRPSRKQGPSALHREPRQLQVRIALNDPVERNDGGGRDRLGRLDPVAAPVRDAAAASGSTASAPASGTCADQDAYPPRNFTPRRRVRGVWPQACRGDRGHRDAPGVRERRSFAWDCESVPYVAGWGEDGAIAAAALSTSTSGLASTTSARATRQCMRTHHACQTSGGCPPSASGSVRRGARSLGWPGRAGSPLRAC